MGTPTPPSITGTTQTETNLSPYLTRHANLGFSSQDVAALIDCIESSQNLKSPSMPQLPAEVLIHILEYVPVDYALSWRLVCRGFRDAFDGPILYQYLLRTELIGWLGPRMGMLRDEDWEKISLMRAHFHGLEKDRADPAAIRQTEAKWSGKYAVFHIEEKWFEEFRRIGGAAARGGSALEDADERFMPHLVTLQLRRKDETDNMLRWCVKLDRSVLDMDYPIEPNVNPFYIDVHLSAKEVKVAWRPMLFRFLKAETAFSKLLKKKRNPSSTSSHFSDCLRAVRRPATARENHHLTPSMKQTEDNAVHILTLLRREITLNPRQLAYLHGLANKWVEMYKEMNELQGSFDEFKHNLLNINAFRSQPWRDQPFGYRVSSNPVAWPDDLRIEIEDRIKKWKSQKNSILQMKMLLSASNDALTLSEDAFDASASEI